MASPQEVRGRFLAAIAAHDLEQVVACYGEDALLIAPEGRFEGRDYIEAYYRIQLTAFPDLGLTVAATHDLEEVGVGEWSFTGTNTGELELPGGEVVPPTGRRVTQRGADIAVIREGRIQEHRLYYDQLELIEQLGVQTAVQA
jgi:ketosteroid isomerase-like protein